MKRSIHKIAGVMLVVLPYFVFRIEKLVQCAESMKFFVLPYGWLSDMMIFLSFIFVGAGLALIACDGPLKVRIKKPELIAGGLLLIYCAVMQGLSVAGYFNTTNYAIPRYDFLKLLSVMTDYRNFMRAVVYVFSAFLTVYGLFGGKRED